MKSIAAIIVIVLVGLTGMISAENPKPLHVYFESGDTMEQITDRGVTVTTTLREVGKENWLWVYISNDSKDAINVFPASIKLHQNSPRNKELRMKTEDELRRAGGHRVFWGQVIAGVGAGLSRNVSTASTTDAYGNSFRTVVNTPDYQAQAQWLAWADQRVQKEQAISDFNRREWLRANTLFPGTAYAGRLIFVRDKSFRSGVVRISIEARNYEFAFPAPQSARPPETAPYLSPLGSSPLSVSSGMTTSDVPSGSATETGATMPASLSMAGRIGISGANWEQGGVRGVQILGVAPDSAAETAGLHVGDVITGINGRKTHSIQELGAALAEGDAGDTVSVAYVFKSNLGWMPTHTVALLAK